MRNPVPCLVSEFRLHIGDDYMTVTMPNGTVLTAKYPDDDDKKYAQNMVTKLNKE